MLGKLMSHARVTEEVVLTAVITVLTLGEEGLMSRVGQLRGYGISVDCMMMHEKQKGLCVMIRESLEVILKANDMEFLWL